MEKYNVLDFTNREVEALALEYISLKLKREFKVIDTNGTRNKALHTIELVYVVQDKSEREIQF